MLVRADDVGERGELVIDQYDAELSEILGGIARRALIVLAGDGGAGKSKLSAQLGAAVAKQRGGLCYWLDRDQHDPALVFASFEHVGASLDRVVLVQERDAEDPAFTPLDAADALAAVPDDAAVLVLDSLETWGGTFSGQADLARAIRQHRAAVKIVIAATNARGEVAGDTRLRRAGDATVIVAPDELRVDKCRWLPDCPRVFPRRARGPATPPAIH